MRILTKWEHDTYQEHQYCGVYLDIEKGNKIIEEEDKLYQEFDKLVNRCNKCYIESYERGEDPIFKNKDTCDKSCMKTDRNGLYCKNRVSGYDNPHNHYYGVEGDSLD